MLLALMHNSKNHILHRIFLFNKDCVSQNYDLGKRSFDWQELGRENKGTLLERQELVNVS